MHEEGHTDLRKGSIIKKYFEVERRVQPGLNFRKMIQDNSYVIKPTRSVNKTQKI